MPSAKLNVFLSYAREDEEMKNELDKALAMLKQNEKIEVWHDRKVVAGQDWDEAIKKELAVADIILLLISPDFNNSKTIWENELKTAMERHDKGLSRVIPVILRSCEYADMPYAKLYPLPSGGMPVKKFSDRDTAWTEVAKGIRGVVDQMCKNRS